MFHKSEILFYLFIQFLIFISFTLILVRWPTQDRHVHTSSQTGSPNLELNQPWWSNQNDPMIPSMLRKAIEFSSSHQRWTLWAFSCHSLRPALDANDWGKPQEPSADWVDMLSLSDQRLKYNDRLDQLLARFNPHANFATGPSGIWSKETLMDSILPIAFR